MPEFYLDYDISELEEAQYNPRSITEKNLDILCESIERLGVVKPLLARGKVLVAGHQRLKALRRLGFKKAPVCILDRGVNFYDEIRFNQFHNGVEIDSDESNCIISGGCELGYHKINPDRIEANFRSRYAGIRKDIAKLLVKYGEWGSIVALENREVSEVVRGIYQELGG